MIRRRGYIRSKSSASKYKNERKARGFDGHTYHSSLEASVSNRLLAEEKDGKLRVIARQQHIHLFSEDEKLCEYWPDFTVWQEGAFRWIEAKGFEKPDWLIKLNLWRVGGAGPLEIWGGSWRRPVLREVIIPKFPGKHVRQEQVFGRLEALCIR